MSSDARSVLSSSDHSHIVLPPKQSKDREKDERDTPTVDRKKKHHERRRSESISHASDHDTDTVLAGKKRSASIHTAAPPRDSESSSSRSSSKKSRQSRSRHRATKKSKSKGEKMPQRSSKHRSLTSVSGPVELPYGKGESSTSPPSHRSSQSSVSPRSSSPQRDGRHRSYSLSRKISDKSDKSEKSHKSSHSTNKRHSEKRRHSKKAAAAKQRQSDLRPNFRRQRGHRYQRSNSDSSAWKPVKSRLLQTSFSDEYKKLVPSLNTAVLPPRSDESANYLPPRLGEVSKILDGKLYLGDAEAAQVRFLPIFIVHLLTMKGFGAAYSLWNYSYHECRG